MERRSPINHRRGRLREAECRGDDSICHIASVGTGLSVSEDRLIIERHLDLVDRKTSLTVQDCVYYLHFSLLLSL